MLTVSRIPQNFKSVKNKENKVNTPEQKSSYQTFDMVKPGVENLKANFAVNFKAKISTIQGSQLNQTAIQVNLENLGPLDTDVKSLPQAQFFDHPYYKDTARDLAILLGPDKNVIVPYEEGTNLNLLIHRFTRDVLNGKYKGEGLLPDTTEIHIIDELSVTRRGIHPLKPFADTITKLPKDEKKIIFIKSFENFLFNTACNGLPVVALCEDGFGKNIQVVALLSREWYNIIAGNKMQGVSPAALKPFGKLELNGLGAKDTKELLKKGSGDSLTRYLADIQSILKSRTMLLIRLLIQYLQLLKVLSPKKH